MIEQGWESTGDPGLDCLLAAAEDAIAAVASFDLESLVRLDGPSTGLHAAARRVEVLRRSLTGFDSGYVAAVEMGGEPARYARSSTAVFLRQQLRLTHGEARRRVAIAHATTPRAGIGGEPLPPQCPALAQAITAGEVSADHAGIVVKVLEDLPRPVRAEHGPFLEAELVTAARSVGPADLAGLGRDLLARVDPDGTLRDYEHAHAHRTLWLRPNPLGAGGRIGGDLDAELFEKLQTVLSPLSKPVPAIPEPATAPSAGEASAADGRPDGEGGVAAADVGFGSLVGMAADCVDGRDRRTAGQRLHDGLLDLVNRSLNTSTLPAAGGTPTAVVFHINEERLNTEYGLAITDHGALVPIPGALRMAEQSLIYTLITSSTQIPLWLGRTTRIATPGQSIALAARDRGCVFPDCDRPPEQTERHHVIEWVDGGPTTLDNLCLLCGYHHREFKRRGWRIIMINGQPWCIPPVWIDPEQKPIRNTRHQPLTNAS